MYMCGCLISDDKTKFYKMLLEAISLIGSQQIRNQIVCEFCINYDYLAMTMYLYTCMYLQCTYTDSRWGCNIQKYRYHANIDMFTVYPEDSFNKYVSIL